MTTTNGEDRYSQLVERTWREPEFKARLLADPAAVLREAGIDIPEGTTVQVLEPNETNGYLILPPKPQSLGAEGTPDEVQGYVDVSALVASQGGYSPQFYRVNTIFGPLFFRPNPFLGPTVPR